MKFKNGDILYYVDPFVFIIDQVLIEYSLREDNGELFYIDNVEAYLKEENLFQTLEEAKLHANMMLRNFVNRKLVEIKHSNPQLRIKD